MSSSARKYVQVSLWNCGRQHTTDNISLGSSVRVLNICTINSCSTTTGISKGEPDNYSKWALLPLNSGDAFGKNIVKKQDEAIYRREITEITPLSWPQTLIFWETSTNRADTEQQQQQQNSTELPAQADPLLAIISNHKWINLLADQVVCHIKVQVCKTCILLSQTALLTLCIRNI